VGGVGQGLRAMSREAFEEIWNVLGPESFLNKDKCYELWQACERHMHANYAELIKENYIHNPLSSRHYPESSGL
jgi:hypothetical protein